MARSSILLTTGCLPLPLGKGAEFVDQRGAVVACGGLRHVESHDDAAVRIRVENLDDLGPFVADARRHVSQNISHIVAALAVVEVAEPVTDEYRPDLVFERQTIGQLAVHEGSGGQYAAELYGRVVVA